MFKVSKMVDDELVIDYVHKKIQAEAFQTEGFTVEEVESMEEPKNKGGRPKKIEE
jgi:hypothetical protein